MKTFQTISAMFLLLFFTGCSQDKPSDDVINNFIKSKFERKENRIDFGCCVHRIEIQYDDAKLINQWWDENEKGIYYIKVSYVDRSIHKDRYPSQASRYETTWGFKKEGKQWTPELSEKENRFIENVPIGNNNIIFEGTYIIPYDNFYSDGKLVFKVIDSKLIGTCERYINPMAGYFKEKYEISNISNNGVGKYKCIHEEYNNDNILRKEGSKNSIGSIYFLGDRVKIDNNIYMKAQ